MGTCLLSRLRSAADEVIWCWPHPALNYSLRLCSKEATFLNFGKFISKSSHWVLGKRREAEPEPALYGRPISVGSSPPNLYCTVSHSLPFYFPIPGRRITGNAAPSHSLMNSSLCSHSVDHENIYWPGPEGRRSSQTQLPMVYEPSLSTQSF